MEEQFDNQPMQESSSGNEQNKPKFSSHRVLVVTVLTLLTLIVLGFVYMAIIRMNNEGNQESEVVVEENSGYRPATKEEIEQNIKERDISLIVTKREDNTGEPYYINRKDGMTLYTKEDNSCEEECLEYWLPFVTNEAFNALQLGTEVLGDGTFQYTWEGKRMYVFSGDAEIGDMNGHDPVTGWSIIRPKTETD